MCLQKEQIISRQNNRHANSKTDRQNDKYLDRQKGGQTIFLFYMLHVTCDM